MDRESVVGANPTPLVRLVAIGWLAVLTFVYLFRYEGWLIPLQTAHLIAKAGWPTALGPQFARFACERLLDFGCLAAIVATAFGVGAVLVGRLVPTKDLLAALFVLAVGLAVLAAAVLVVGFFSVGRIPWVFLLAVCWCWPAPRAFLRWRSLARSPGLGWAWLVVGVIVMFALLNLPGALAPPFEYDELEYHLGALSEYISAGRILFLPHNFYSNLPQLTEMLYLLASLTSSDIAAKLLHWLFGVLTAVTVYALGTRLWTKRVGVLAAALVYCLPFVQDLSETARIDLATTFFAALAFGGLLVEGGERKAESGERKAESGKRKAESGKRRAESGKGKAEGGRPAVGPSAGSGDPRTTGGPSAEDESRTTSHGSRVTDHESRSWLWLSALAAGGAVATKWTAVAVVLLPALIFVLVRRRSLRPAAAYCLLAGAVVLPWLVKNAVLAGDPIYPLLDRWLPGVYWSPEQTALFARRHYPSFGWNGLRQFGELAWNYSFAEPRAAPLLLLTAPLILLLRRDAAPGWRAARRAGWLFVGAYTGWWLLTFRPWRFLFPAFPLAALVGAYAVVGFGRARLVRWVAGGALGIVLVVGLATQVMSLLVDVEDPARMPPRLNLLEYALGGATRAEFLARVGHGVFEPILWMNEHLPATAKVLYVGEARAYYARHPVFWSTAFDQHPLTALAEGTRSVDELWRRLRASGVRYIYVNFSELQRLAAGYNYLLDIDWNQFRNLLQRRARVVHEAGRSVVFELER